MDDNLHTSSAQSSQSSGEESLDRGVTSQQDPLAALERQWDRLAKSIRDLRDENAVLLEQSQEQEEQIARMEQEAVARTKELAELDEEKKRTIVRIESLLARFGELEQ